MTRESPPPFHETAAWPASARSLPHRSESAILAQTLLVRPQPAPNSPGRTSARSGPGAASPERNNLWNCHPFSYPSSSDSEPSLGKRMADRSGNAGTARGPQTLGTLPVPRPAMASDFTQGRNGPLASGRDRLQPVGMHCLETGRLHLGFPARVAESRCGRFLLRPISALSPAARPPCPRPSPALPARCGWSQPLSLHRSAVAPGLPSWVVHTCKDRPGGRQVSQ